MNPLWITLHISRNSKWKYRLMTHFAQPTRIGTKRECNYEWYGSAYTFNDFEKLKDVPTAISDLIIEASKTSGESFSILQQLFTTGEIALEITEQGVTWYKPYNKNKSKVQDTTSKSKQLQQLDSVLESVLHNEMPMIEDTLPAAPDVFISDVKSLI